MHSAISSVCYGISDMSNGHNGTVFRVLYPKISTGQEKLAPTGRHGRHVFATLIWSSVFGHGHGLDLSKHSKSKMWIQVRDE